ncbi:MAG: IS110 family transposase [Oligoflexales bacterium]
MKGLYAIGIDLAKTSFHVYGSDNKGKCLFRFKASRSVLVEKIAQIPSTKIFMESCGSSNFWARKLMSLGHKVQLISPQFVKPFLKSNKNDYLDAEAIVEAGSRANMRFVAIKQTWHQDIQTIHRIRERHIHNRTALSNQIRGILLEYGIEVRVGLQRLFNELPVILENRSGMLSPIALVEIDELYEDLKHSFKKVEDYDKKIKLQSELNEDCKRVMKLKGVGPIIATAIVAATPDPKMYKNGRNFAAWLGVVPKQHSSGGKNTLLGISKRGDVYIRKQLIHGCRSTVYRSKPDGDDLQKWIYNLKKRKGSNKATVALANKNARLIWAILTKKEAFNFVA